MFDSPLKRQVEELQVELTRVAAVLASQSAAITELIADLEQLRQFLAENNAKSEEDPPCA